MKFIHWEYNENVIPNYEEGETSMAAGFRRHKDTDRITGVYFRWRYLLRNDNIVNIHAVCEDSYNDHFKDVSDLRIMLINSLANFRRLLYTRLDIIEALFPDLHFEVPDEDLQVLVDELNQR